MNKTIILSLALAALTAGDAGASPVLGNAECKALAQDIAYAYEAKRLAEQKKQNAWKTPVPFAALGRAANANEDIKAAQARLDTLQDAYFRQNCAVHTG